MSKLIENSPVCGWKMKKRMTTNKSVILSLGLIFLGLVLIVLGVVLVFTIVCVPEVQECFYPYVFPGVALGSWGFVSIVWGVIHSPLRKEVSSSIVSLILSLHIIGLLVIIALIGRGSLGFAILIFIPCIIADAMGLYFIKQPKRSENQIKDNIGT